VYGELHIAQNTTLTDNQYGSVVFDADDILLDCNGHSVNFSSSYSVANCAGKKCGIVAAGKSSITIWNCVVNGSFDTGVQVTNGSYSGVAYTSVYGSSTGFYSGGNTDAWFENLISRPRVGSSSRGLLISNDQFGSYAVLDIAPASTGTIGSGIGITGSGEVAIDRATVTRSGLGIFSTNSYRTSVGSSNVSGQTTGIYISGGYQHVISSSQVHSNSIYGIQFASVMSTVISSGSITNNGQCDVKGSGYSLQNNPTIGTRCN
jgi:hypothetical protein